MHYIPFLSTLVTFAFAAAVFARFLKRRGPHLLFWTIGLLFFGIGTLSEVILAFTFSGLLLKLWYLSGAMLTAAWLGQGTIHLLVRKRGIAWTLTGILAAVSLLAVALIILAPLTPAAASYNVTMAISSQYKDILTRGSLTILLTILLNIYGTLALVGRRDLLGIYLLAQACAAESHDWKCAHCHRCSGPRHGRFVCQGGSGRWALPVRVDRSGADVYWLYPGDDCASS